MVCSKIISENKTKIANPYRRKTDQDMFRNHIGELISENTPLKTHTHIEHEIKNLNKSIKTAA